MPRYAPELRSLRGPIRGAPPIRMGGPTEQYERSRGQQKSFGLGQLYPQQQLQGPEITGWQPGPLQTDPIRRVDRDPAKRGLTLAGEREEEGRRLRQRAEITEEFAAPPREQARRDRLRREFIDEQEQADKDALAARQREEKQRQESVKRGGLAQILQPLYVESGMSPQEANIAATQAVTSDRAEDEIDRLNKQKADTEEARIKQQAGQAKRGRLAGALPGGLRPAEIGPEAEIPSLVRRGDISYAGGRAAISAEEQARKTEAQATEVTAKEEATKATRERANEAAQMEYLDYQDQSTETKKALRKRAEQAVLLENDLGAKIFLGLVGEKIPRYAKE